MLRSSPQRSDSFVSTSPVPPNYRTVRDISCFSVCSLECGQTRFADSAICPQLCCYAVFRWTQFTANASHITLSELKDQPLCFFNKAALTDRFGCWCSIITAREESFKESWKYCENPLRSHRYNWTSSCNQLQTAVRTRKRKKSLMEYSNNWRSYHFSLHHSAQHWHIQVKCMIIGPAPGRKRRSEREKGKG